MHTAIHYDASAYMQMTANVMGKSATYVLDSSLDHEVSDDYGQLLAKFGLNLTIDELGSNVYATVSKGYRAGGYNIMLPNEDENIITKKQLMEQVAGLMGGRAGEEVVVGDKSTGASNDFEQATNIARGMVTLY